METSPLLPASAWHHVWNGGRRIDVEGPIPFDAHPALTGLTPEQFRRTASLILSGAEHCGDELALSSPSTQKWFYSDRSYGFRITILREDFEDWLEMHGMDVSDAMDYCHDTQAALLDRLDGIAARLPSWVSDRGRWLRCEGFSRCPVRYQGRGFAAATASAA